MFDNPILFALLISIIVTLVFFFINKDKDKKDPDPTKNTKYLVVFGIIFIITLIGKICYGCNTCHVSNIEDKILSGGNGNDNLSGDNGLSNSTSNDSSNWGNDAIDVGETPPF